METLVKNTIDWFQFINSLTEGISNFLSSKTDVKYNQLKEKLYDEITNCLFSIDGDLNSYKLEEVEKQFLDRLNQFFHPIAINDPTSSNFILEGEKQFDEKEEIDSDNLRLLGEDTTPYSNNDLNYSTFFWYKIKEENYFEINDVSKYVSQFFNEVKPFTKKDKIILFDPITPDLYIKIINNPYLMKTLDWRVFEKLLANILESHGYNIKLIGGTKDNGIDIIAFSKPNGISGIDKYIIQAKRYSNKKVSVEPIKSLVYTHMQEKATKSILATTSEFTRGAWKLAKMHQWNIELKDFDGLFKWVENTAKIKALI